MIEQRVSIGNQRTVIVQYIPRGAENDAVFQMSATWKGSPDQIAFLGDWPVEQWTETTLNVLADEPGAIVELLVVRRANLEEKNPRTNREDYWLEAVRNLLAEI